MSSSGRTLACHARGAGSNPAIPARRDRRDVPRHRPGAGRYAKATALNRRPPGDRQGVRGVVTKGSNHMPEIRKVLTVSASHLPAELAGSMAEDSSDPRGGILL